MIVGDRRYIKAIGDEAAESGGVAGHVEADAVALPLVIQITLCSTIRGNFMNPGPHNNIKY